MKDGDPDETSSVEETSVVFESIPPQAGPSGETVEPTILFGTSFQVDLEKQLRKIKEIQLKGIPEGTESIPISPVVTLTEPVLLRVQARPPTEPIYQKRTVTLAVPLETAAKNNTKPAVTVPMTTMGGGDTWRVTPPPSGAVLPSTLGRERCEQNRFPKENITSSTNRTD